jgi:hypothetical protein
MPSEALTAHTHPIVSLLPIPPTPYHARCVCSGAVYVHAADLDGDGDVDLASASQSDNKVAWYVQGCAGGSGLLPSNPATSNQTRSVLGPTHPPAVCHLPL